MLCSAPATKSGSNWLDRLRSIKGIPTGDNLDLDSFLSNNTNHSSPNTHHNHNHNHARGSDDSSSPGSDPPSMGSVLAHLFNMGSSFSQSYKLCGKKCPRKQTNPRSFVPSNVGNNGVVECSRKEEKNVIFSDVNENEDELLKGFSKSEVTVIDTSCEEWKVDKVVFRKENVWKVREKKGKCKFFGRKKRKGSFGGIDDKEVGVLDSQFKPQLETDNEEFEFSMQSTQVQSTEKTIEDVGVDSTQNDPKPPFKKRFQFSRSPTTSRKENNSEYDINNSYIKRHKNKNIKS